MRGWRHLWVLAIVWGLSTTSRGDDASPSVDYANDIKPILTRHCTSCHGAEKQKSGLRVDNPKLAIQGGDSGPAIEPGKSADSLLFQAISGAEGVSVMPPQGQPRLKPEEIALIKAWIDQGAKVPQEDPGAAEKTTQQKGANHWAFRPIVRPAVPKVVNDHWIRNPIDAFILARLEKESIHPSPEADRVTLIRRLYFDLLGLPPTAAEVDAYLSDSNPDAYERLVDRLLASPHYGERWGRHWLDLARYADSNGFTRDFARSIWKYRDWVIDATNRDLPFDQFAIEQIAGDMLPGATTEQLIATGFHRNTLINEEGGTDPEQFRVESVVDRVNTTGVTFLGLTVGCAQCHEHKYDPITQREYYQLFAFLNNAEEPKLDVPTPDQLATGMVQKREEVRRQIADLEKQFAQQAEQFQKSLDAWEGALTDETRKKLPPEVLNAVNLAVVMRSDQNKKDLADYYRKLPEARTAYPVLEEIAKLRSIEPVFTTTMIMQERPQPRETFIHVRGDFLRKGARVEPGIPAALPGLPEGTQSANRLDFARWLVSPRNPLTPRVTVNRIWQRYFGRGIVETENDFGTQGIPPTHPELLDWLAVEFMSASGSTGPQTAWSLKRFHKLIVTSATYRQSSNHRSDLQEIDAGNRLYARQSRLRLDAEVIRDVALAAGGLFNPTVGGPSVYPPQPDGVFDFTQDKKPWNTAIGPDRYRRGMYTYLWRSSPYPAMTVFDFPDANVTCTRRNRSNTPLQSLTLANDQQFVEIAQGLAQRVLTAAVSDDAARLRYAFRACLAREPNDAERSRLLKLLTQQRTEFAANLKEAERLTPSLVRVQANVQEFAAWTAVARVLLNLDEFITRE
jgi:mono/diheme cytochrome c family protein